MTITARIAARFTTFAARAARISPNALPSASELQDAPTFAYECRICAHVSTAHNKHRAMDAHCAHHNEAHPYTTPTLPARHVTSYETQQASNARDDLARDEWWRHNT